MPLSKCARAGVLALTALAAACADGGALPTAPAAPPQAAAAGPAAAAPVSLHQHRSGYVLASGRGGSATVAAQKQ
jgi:hypothetical protein